MAKAGILSMQRILNYGSFLQAYALRKVLEELGWEVQFADYHSGRCLEGGSEKRGISRKLSKAAQTLGYNASLKDKLEFIRYKKNYAGQYFPLLGIEQNQMNYFPRLDLLVIGSDEVFNCVQDNTNVGYARELFGYGNKASTLISYAASFGNTTLDKIEKYGVAETLVEDLKKFDRISVRDYNSQNIVKELTGLTPPIHPDPVLLYDWEKEIPGHRPLEENYLLVYGYSGRFSAGECESIEDFADRHGLKIVCLGGVQNIRNTFVNCSPFEVLSYFANAEYVVTDTFHGVLLSVVMRRRFAAFVRNEGYGNAEKLGGALAMLGLEQRKVVALENLARILQSEPAYSEIDGLLAKWKEQAYQYLREEAA